MKKQPFDPAALIARARDHLAAGRFFVALDLAGEADAAIGADPGTLDTERLRVELAQVMSAAQARTDEAIEYIREMHRRGPQHIVKHANYQRQHASAG